MGLLSLICRITPAIMYLSTFCFQFRRFTKAGGHLNCREIFGLDDRMTVSHLSYHKNSGLDGPQRRPLI